MRKDFFSKFCLYNKEHDIVAVWQTDFGIFCFSVGYFASHVPFLKVGMEIKML